MVNWVEAQEPILHWLVRGAGLRQQTIEIEPGTVISMWVPKEKVMATNKEVVPDLSSDGSCDEEEDKRKKKKKKQRGKEKEKPAVVLVHGFAAEGIVTWQFQFGVLVSQYEVYIPDLFFFGGSTTAAADRSPAFQAECLAAALDKLSVRRCTAVGFSYGGMVAFKMAELRPDLVRSLVVSGSVFAMTDSISRATLDQLGFASSSELLMPESIKGLKALLSVSMYKKLWFPDFLYKDYLEVMFSNRKERAELLEGLVNSNKDAKVPPLDQRILLLWGENDNIFNLELAKDMKEQLGEKTTLQSIKKAGHLLHVERPCAYNRHLKKFLALIKDEGTEE
ncbi:alpha/beta hydrolase fold [Musa troglodytarum]|uniref:Alpha/beta hydrolase fold n=1 Tax=Musa troglodytarum TaxID=320322 RepID=A0A9E7GEG4_9LILI|nr:alpha/beta hydrolase fold [Musa troglodytarum]